MKKKKQNKFRKGYQLPTDESLDIALHFDKIRKKEKARENTRKTLQNYRRQQRNGK